MIEPYFSNENITLYKGDCLEILPTLDIKFDMCLTDPPYGTTQNKWDNTIPFDPMWNELNRLVKENGAVVLFGQDKFTAIMMLSNIQNHRYNLIWKKGERGSGFINSNRMPLRNHK